MGAILAQGQPAARQAGKARGISGALLRMWQGEDTSGDLRAILARKSGADRQEALSEVLFHSGAFERFVRNDPEAGRQTLARLNQLAPYGSVEWIYGRRILQ